MSAGAIAFGLFVGALFVLTSTFVDQMIAVVLSILIGVISFIVLAAVGR